MSEELLAAPLVPDPRAALELSGEEAEALSNDEVAGARIRLLRRTIERIKDGDAVAVALTAEFHPAPATRFKSATVSLRLTAPAGAKVIEVAPVELRTTDPVTFKITRSGKISFEKFVKAEAGVTDEVSYSTYPCLVRGAGAASLHATWLLEERAQARDGIGQQQDLVLTLRGTGPFQAEVLVSAQLLKPGLAGALERFRDLILGPSLREGRTESVSLTVPPAPERSGLFAFLH